MNISQVSKNIAKGGVIVFAGMLISRLLAYLYVALVARLGSSEYGLLSLAIVIVSFLSIIATFGFRTGIIRYIAYYKGKKDDKGIKGSIISSLKVSLPLSIFLTFILFIFSEKISVLIFHNPDLTPILRIISLSLPFLALSELFISAITGFQKIEYKVLIKEIIENTLKLLLTFLVIYFGYKLFGVTVVYVITMIVSAILSFYFLQKKIFPFLKTKVIPKPLTKELIVFSLPLIFSSFFTLIVKWTDVLMIGYFRNASDVGVYNVALPTANLLTLIPTSMMAIFMPIIMEFYSKKKFKEIKNISIINSKWIFFLNFPIFLLILLFSKQILSIMFGSEYIVGSLALTILLFGYMVRSLTHVNSAILIMLKKTKLLFFSGLIAAIFNIILNYLLIPKFGIIGGAIATSFSFIVTFLFVFIYSYKLTGIQPIKWNYLKSIIAGIISCFIVKYISGFVDNISFIPFVLFSILFLIIYGLLIYFFKGLNNEDKEIINSFYLKFKSIKFF